jgi:hypothetical protein
MLFGDAKDRVKDILRALGSRGHGLKTSSAVRAAQPTV